MSERRQGKDEAGITRRGFLLSVGTLGLGLLAGRFLGWRPEAQTQMSVMPLADTSRTEAKLAAQNEAVMKQTGWLDVKSYGAKGDGQANDTAAIRKAIAAAEQSEGVVYFPKGTYIIKDTLHLRQPVKLTGAGKDLAILRMTKRNLDAIHISSTKNVHISHLQVRDVKNVEGGENTGIHVYASDNCTIEHVRVVGSDDSGIRVGFGKSKASRNCKVLHCEVEDTKRGSGIEVIRAEEALVQGCTVRGSYQHGIRLCGAKGAIVLSNRIYGSGMSDISIQGFGNGRQVTHPVEDFIVSHNKCHGKESGFTVFNSAVTGLVSNNIVTGSAYGMKIYDPEGYGNRDIQILGNTFIGNVTGLSIRGDQKRLMVQQNTIIDFRKRGGSGVNVYAIDVAGEGKVLDLTIEHNSLVNKYSAEEDRQVAIRVENTAKSSKVYFRYNQIRFKRPSNKNKYWLHDGKGELIRELKGGDTNTPLAYG